MPALQSQDWVPACKHGHLLTDDNVYVEPRKSGPYRTCRRCKLDRASARARSADGKARDREYRERWKSDPERVARKTAYMAAYAAKRWREDPKFRARSQRRTREWQRRQAVEGRNKFWLKTKYGLEIADFDRMLAEQVNACAICEVGFESRASACVDHDHATGAVRQLLCVTCNAGLGLLKDSYGLVSKAAAYLKKWER